MSFKKERAVNATISSPKKRYHIHISTGVFGSVEWRVFPEIDPRIFRVEPMGKGIPAKARKASETMPYSFKGGEKSKPTTWKQKQRVFAMSGLRHLRAPSVRLIKSSVSIGAQMFYPGCMVLRQYLSQLNSSCLIGNLMCLQKLGKHNLSYFENGFSKLESIVPLIRVSGQHFPNPVRWFWHWWPWCSATTASTSIPPLII